MKKSYMEKIREKHTDIRLYKKVFCYLLILIMALSVSACAGSETAGSPHRTESGNVQEQGGETLSIEEIVGSCELEDVPDIPAYSGETYTVINDNIPYFAKSNLPTESFEYYSELDELGRCGVACANIGQDIMPTEERGEIGQIKPSGWQTVKYDNVDGKYLYNRCHLIGYQLTAENANVSNLVTGTRYLNIEGMLPFENMAADYIKETGNHVEYHVTPVFEGENLLATGVLMEGYSVEDQGDGVCFCVFAYNVQPGVNIDYATGDSSLAEVAAQPAASPTPTNPAPPAEEPPANQQPDPEPQGNTYILNTNTKKFHYPGCSSVDQMKESNKQVYTGSREDIISLGYVPCKRCNP